MAHLHLRVLPPALSFAFVIIAFVFSVLTITSKKWAVRDNFDPQLPPVNWTKPYYTRYRSPFQICEGIAVESAEESDSTPPPPNVICTHYTPFGRNSTSCELEVVTEWDQTRTLGDVRLCQQIHYAGNFGIASTCFIGLGFLATIGVLLLSFFRRQQNKDEHHERYRHSQKAQYVSLLLQVFLFVGFATGIISQFYGILGFIQSSPNQADFASSNGQGGSTETQVNGQHGSWYQGVALSTYATCSWAFAAAAGIMASRIWRVPDWNVAA